MSPASQCQDNIRPQACIHLPSCLSALSEVEALKVSTCARLKSVQVCGSYLWEEQRRFCNPVSAIWLLGITSWEILGKCFVICLAVAEYRPCANTALIPENILTCLNINYFVYEEAVIVPFCRQGKQGIKSCHIHDHVASA